MSPCASRPGFEDAQNNLRVVDVVREDTGLWLAESDHVIWILMWWGRLGTILICIRVLLTVSRNHFVSPIVEMLGHLMTILRLTKVDMCWSRMGLCHLYSSRPQWTNQSRWHLKTRGQTSGDRDYLSLIVSASSRPSPGGYWPLIGWEWSRVLDTGLWLAENDHVTRPSHGGGRGWKAVDQSFCLRLRCDEYGEWWVGDVTNMGGRLTGHIICQN